jgi:rod shape-determining protein MreD
MFILLSFIISYFTVVIQNTPAIYRRICLFGVGPDLVLVVVLRIALEGKIFHALLFGFFIGLLQDCYSARLFGLNALLKCGVAFVISVYSEHIFKSNPLIQIILVLSVKLVHDVIFLLIYNAGEMDQGIYFFYRYSLLSILYSGLIAPIVFLLLRPLSFYQRGYR